MVRTGAGLALLAWVFAAAPGMSQTVDWGAAGGDLFGASEAAAASGAPDETEAAVRLPALDPPYREAMLAAAAKHGIDPKLLFALVLTESGYRADAVSPAGAAGLTQLMPATARDLGVADRFDPVENLQGGADYLARQLARFGDVRLALAAYNAGPARIAAYGGAPPFAETRRYVATVVECYLALTAGRDVRSARACARPEVRP